MKGSFHVHKLKFGFNAKTSRGKILSHSTYIIKIEDENSPGFGLGECAPLEGLSRESGMNISDMVRYCLEKLSDHILPETREEAYQMALDLAGMDSPALRFALETAMLDLMNGSNRILFRNEFVQSGDPISINGLIWMADSSDMLKQGLVKIDSGYSCIKMKIGAIDFDEELRVLLTLRENFPKGILRVDANGAFDPGTAMIKLSELSSINIHSIEQPISPGQEAEMAKLCRNTSVPIALDEELIHNFRSKEKLLDQVKPQYIVLKPTLLGGFLETSEWIAAAEERNIGWWITSALESNIGLNAIAQFTSETKNEAIHGLGTGQIYNNNIGSPLQIVMGQLFYQKNKRWNYSELGDFID